MSSGGAPKFKLTLKKTPSQPASQGINGVQAVGSGEQRARAPAPHAAPPIPAAAAGARPAAAGQAPKRMGLTLKGAKSSSTPQASAGTPAVARISLKGASSSHATPAAAAPQQATVPATPASAPSTGPRRLALKGQGSRPPAAGTPATPASAAAAATPASAPKTAPPAVGNAAAGFATPRPAAQMTAATPARAASATPASAAGSAQGSSKPKVGIRLKGSSSTPAAARQASATPGSMLRPAATPGSGTGAAAGGSGTLKRGITLKKSMPRHNSMGLSQQHSMQPQISLQPSVGPPLQPVAYKEEAYKQQQQQQAQQEQAAQQSYDYYSLQGMQGYDSSHAAAAGYGAYHDYSAAGTDPAAAAAAGGMYGAGTDYTAMGMHASTDPAAAAAGGMYGAGHDMHSYGMHGYDAAAAAATAVVDYSAYYQPKQQKGQKRKAPAPKPAAAPAVVEPLGPRTKRPKPGQFRDTEEEDADEDFNPKAERARAMRSGGSGGIATARVKSKGPSGARAAGGWPAARPAAPAARAGSNRAAAAQKAAHRAAQNAAQRMHPHAHMGVPPRAGGGHMSAAVPTHRPRQHMMPAASGALAAAAAPRSPVLGEDNGALPSGADLAAAFANSAAAQDMGAAVGIDLETAPSAEPVTVTAARTTTGRGGGGARGRGVAQHKPPEIETVLAELHSQVEYVEETHPPTRENLLKLLAAVDKRDKYRFFGKPVTEEQAPGYFKTIKNPMDLSAMRAKVDGGMYSSWNELMADIILMCANAKVFNHPNTKPHKEADTLFKYSMKYIKSFKQGKTALRGAVAMAVRNANNADAAAGGGGAGTGEADAGAEKAAASPSGPMTRNARRGGRRPREEDEAAGNKSNKRQRQPKFIPLSQNVDFSLGSSLDGDSARETFKGRPKLYVAAWGGLADGASPEGVPFGGNGRHVLRCVGGHAATLPPDTYLTSLSRFVAGAGAAVEKLVLKLFGQDLSSKLVPIPGVTPTQAAQQPGAHAAAAAHRHPHQQQQQQQQVAGPGMQLPVQARVGMGPVPVGSQALQQQQPAQQQSLAGLFGGGLGGVGGITPAQLAQLQQQNQLQQLRQQQQQQQGAAQGAQQFVPGPGAAHLAMGMAARQS